MKHSFGQYPFFSIVIPTYNREGLIIETLETVFHQNYENYEVIVVDNASTDGTVKLLSPLVEQGKITLIVNPENQERSKARNKGFEAAKGDYLTLLDSDDFMYPSCLKDAAEFVQNKRDVHFFHNYYELVDDNKKPIAQYRFPKPENHIRSFAEGNFISCIGVFMSKEIYNQFKFNEDSAVLGSEDWELWFRILSRYQLNVIPKINNGIRNHANRSISNYQLDSIVERKKFIIDHVLKDQKVKEKFGKYEALMRSSAYVFAAISANQVKNFKKAKSFLMKALKLYPRIIFTLRFIRVAQIANFKIDKTH